MIPVEIVGRDTNSIHMHYADIIAMVVIIVFFPINDSKLPNILIHLSC